MPCIPRAPLRCALGYYLSPLTGLRRHAARGAMPTSAWACSLSHAHADVGMAPTPLHCAAVNRIPPPLRANPLDCASDTFEEAHGMAVPFLGRMSIILAGSLLLLAGPVYGQPGE